MGKRKKIGVIGAGASGLVSAISALRNGAEVTLFEKQKSAGRKITASGNGRCNLSNTDLLPDHFHGANPRFVASILARFGVSELEEFFESVGVPLRLEGERLYPYSLQARTVLEALLFEIERLGGKLLLHKRVDKIISENKNVVITTAGRERHSFDTVIMCTGGKSYSKLGGSQSGYTLAESLGHTVSDLIPSILPISIPYKKIHILQGIKWDCTLKALCEKDAIAESTDEVLFTSYGLSGPAALDISGEVNRHAYRGKPVTIVIDFFPELTFDETKLFITRFCNHRTVKQVLDSILKFKMGELILHYCSIDYEKQASFLSEKELLTVISALKGLEVEAGEPGALDDATVCIGGVRVDEVNQKTLESKIAPNVYLTGELLDIDGDCGGFNLHFAWGTGYIAGEAAAR
jgi:predicted Rossmann fold flavoprotein